MHQTKAVNLWYPKMLTSWTSVVESLRASCAFVTQETQNFKKVKKVMKKIILKHIFYPYSRLATAEKFNQTPV